MGINTGRAVLGNVGGSIGRDYTAIGDAVNMAFRIEAATRTLNTDIVLGKDSYKHLPESVWKGKTHKINVKGKSTEIDVCALNFDKK